MTETGWFRAPWGFIVVAVLAAAFAVTGQTPAAGQTAGDFNGDKRDDLAIGVPFEAIGTIDGAGAVNVLCGSADGLTADGDQFWSQDKKGVLGQAEPGDRFGQSLQ